MAWRPPPFNGCWTAGLIFVAEVDVDNCDCCFLETILETGLKPLLIHVEVSPLVPPPFVYRRGDHGGVLLSLRV